MIVMIYKDKVYSYFWRLGFMEINNGFIRYFDDFLECSMVGVLLDIVILKNEFGIKCVDGR